MTIRTISQLPSILDNIPISQNAFFEVSSPKSGGAMYKSEKCSYNKLQNQLAESISNGIADAYGLKVGTTKYNVKSLNDRVTILETRDTEIKGRKTFSTIPVIDETDVTKFTGTGDITTEQLIPNIGKVFDIVDTRAGFISEQHCVDANPVRNPHSTLESPKFLYWHFDDQGRDSSEWIDPETGQPAGATVVNQSGWLTITGWLADNGNVLTQDAWVGLFGFINARNDDDPSIKENRWVPLQYSPWPISSKSKQRQYVSFGLPVKRGLQLKIMTGFNVDMHGSGFQISNTIQLPLNQPNTFVGYVIYTLNV